MEINPFEIAMRAILLCVRRNILILNYWILIEFSYSISKWIYSSLSSTSNVNIVPINLLWVGFLLFVFHTQYRVSKFPKNIFLSASAIANRSIFNPQFSYMLQILCYCFSSHALFSKHYCPFLPLLTSPCDSWKHPTFTFSDFVYTKQ